MNWEVFLRLGVGTVGTLLERRGIDLLPDMACILRTGA